MRYEVMMGIIIIIIIIQYRLLDRNSPPCYRYKPEPVLESANMILCSERSFITDKTVHFNRPDTALIDKVKQRL